jgi:hypothetical protein
MVDEPWKDKLLTAGQVEQELRRLGCSRVGKEGRLEFWKPPAGPVFAIRLHQTTAVDLEGIANEIKRWVAENQRKN